MKTQASAAILVLLTVSGCGVMGPPVPPNTIGVNVKRHNDTVERERRLKDGQKRQDHEDLSQTPQGLAEQTPGVAEEMLLQGDVVQPAARPDSDFLVRPR